MKIPRADDGRDKNEYLSALMLLTQIGITMVVSIVVGLFLGKFIDDFFRTSPVFTVIFIIFGVIAAFRSLFRITEKFK